MTPWEFSVLRSSKDESFVERLDIQKSLDSIEEPSRNANASQVFFKFFFLGLLLNQILHQIEHLWPF
jgi:hypothetical protein